MRHSGYWTPPPIGSGRDGSTVPVELEVCAPVVTVILERVDRLEDMDAEDGMVVGVVVVGDTRGEGCESLGIVNERCDVETSRGAIRCIIRTAFWCAGKKLLVSSLGVIFTAIITYSFHLAS